MRKICKSCYIDLSMLSHVLSLVYIQSKNPENKYFSHIQVTGHLTLGWESGTRHAPTLILFGCFKIAQRELK